MHNVIYFFFKVIIVVCWQDLFHMIFIAFLVIIQIKIALLLYRNTSGFVYNWLVGQKPAHQTKKLCCELQN